MTVIIPSNLDNILNEINQLESNVIIADYYSFAIIDENSIVTQSIICDYNFAQIHSDKNHCDCILSLSLHKYKFEDYPGKFAFVGFVWDSENQVFYDTQPYPSWILNTQTWIWESTIPYPNDGNQYIWNEETLSWREKILPFNEYNTNLNKN